MKGLLKKELTAIFCSATGISFSFAYLLICGFILWLFSGGYNILDNGYATLDSFFKLSPILLLILIPALTMRSFSEEKKSKTLELSFSQPISLFRIIFSKILAIWFFIIISISVTYVYIFILSFLSNSIDLYGAIISYVLLFALSLVLIVIGIFASSLTSNQIFALILSIILNTIFFFGFDLLSGLFSSGKTQLFVSSLGLSKHYDLMGRGVLQLKDILVFANYIIVFFCLTVYSLSFRNKKVIRKLNLTVGSLVIINIIIFFIPNYRFDFTEDKRYTLSDYSKNILDNIAKEGNRLEINVFLEGDLNPGFQKLQNSIKDILSDFNRLADGRINVSYINPYIYANTPKEVYEYMANKQMNGIILNETDKEGKVSQKVIYPYAQVIFGNDTLPINLLKRDSGRSAEENLNASAENLEFEFIDAIRLVKNKEPRNIAFIEGHGELAEPYVEDATALLSKYYFVNRGEILPDISILKDFKVIIIAGSTQKYSESEKFIIDQYIMTGGRVLWLVDGVYFSNEELALKGESPSIKNETNLDDLLFTYGVRVNPVLLQDMQCSSILLSTGEEGSEPAILPFFYSPLLIPSPNHLVTRGIADVKAAFASSVDAVTKSTDIKKEILLTTSANTHVVKVPEKINFDLAYIQSQPNYFDQPYLPVAVALEGQFKSAYVNRMVPDSIVMHDQQFVKESVYSKMIVVACSDIIRNDIIGQGQQTQVLPMGYDRIHEKQFGNRDFIVNAVNWLANDDEWMMLRNKQQKLRLLNKKLIYENRNTYTSIAIALPLLLMGLLIGGVNIWRRYKYEKR